MNILFRSFFVITISSCFFSCTQSSKADSALAKQEQAFDSIMTQVITIHDEVMPKMGEVNTLINALTPQIDTTAQGASFKKAQDDLKHSHEAMMTWMGEFHDTFPPSNAPETNLDSLNVKMKNLLSEKTKITAISGSIHSGIANAKQLLSAVKDSVQ